MKICLRCQAGPFIDMKGMEHCTKCGTRLSPCPKCKKCGTTLLPSNNHCGGCGLPRGQALIASTQPTDEPLIL